MWPAPVGEVEALARAHGLGVVRIAASEDRLGRPDVHWTTVCLQLPDDGAGALPLIRGVILNDRKSSTYKLALLRAIARIADVAPAFTRLRREGDVVDLPFGLVALFWVRMCPSSDDLGHDGLIGNGCSGSLMVQSMPRADGAASGASRSSAP
jgi:hypothetical protein